MFLQRSLIGASLILSLLSFVPRSESIATPVKNVAVAPASSQAENIRSKNEQTIVLILSYYHKNVWTSG